MNRKSSIYARIYSVHTSSHSDDPSGPPVSQLIRIMRKTKYIVHIDMDAFFAAIEQRDNPALRKRPVIIGADPKQGEGRGVVSTCSYEARRYGIHSAMPISQAYRRCPDGIYLHPDITKYSRESDRVYTIFASFTPDIEAVSIDEAFLDITHTWKLFGSAEALCRQLKNRIYTDTGLSASIGLAPTKLVAKIASDMHKPDGFTRVPPQRVTAFLRPLPIEKIWGIGKKTLPKLHACNIFTVGDIEKWEIEDLTNTFGSTGRYLWNVSRGRGADQLETGEDIKSISNEYTFERDVPNDYRVKETVMRLCEKVSNRMRKQSLKARTFTLKIRLSNFKTCTRAATLPAYTNFAEDIYDTVHAALKSFDTRNMKIRLIGVKATNFGTCDAQPDIFEFGDMKKREKLYSVIDKIKSKYGNSSIFHAASDH